MRKKALPLLVLLFSVSLALPSAAARPEEALAFVPKDAASVGMVRLADLRTSPLSAQLFAHCDELTMDGDAARFLADARLDAKEDVDVVVFAGSPKGRSASGLVVFDGRFEVDNLSAALTARGATRKQGPNGDYFLMPEHHVENDDERPVLAIVDRHTIVAGTEDAVRQALADRAKGGSGFLTAGLGRELSRIDTRATAWALVDTTRLPHAKEHASRMRVDGEVNGQSMQAMVGAMKSVSLLALQATVKGDGLKIDAAGVSTDSETRDLIEDTVRGGLAAMRLAFQEKSPDTVAVLRRFKVKNEGDSVSISGTLPGAAVRAMMDKKVASRTHEK
jgi:hypothetical protein